MSDRLAILAIRRTTKFRPQLGRIVGTEPVNFRTALKGAAAPIALSVALAANPVFAQDTPEEDEDLVADVAVDESEGTIIVTGSRIRRPEVEGAAPLISAIGEEELERRAYTNIGEALNQSPGFGVPVNSTGDQASYTVGQAFVNLFGLGSQRTLTLVNGRRFVSSNTASNFGGANAGLQVDLNVIPISLIERIDTLAVKGATTYGSDAIAGTVNLILKDDFEGLSATGQAGFTERGGAENYFGSVTMGTDFADNRGNIAINFEYDNQKGLLANERERTARGLFFGTTRDPDSPFSQTLYENRRIAATEENGAPTLGAVGLAGLPRFGGFTNADGDVVRFNPSGNLVPFDLGNPDGNVVNAEGGDGFNLNDVSQILSEVERFTTFALGHYDINDSVTAFFEANYSRNEAVELANQPVYNSALFSDKSIGLGVLLSNPFLSEQARETLLLPGNLTDADTGDQILNFDTDGDGVNDDTRFFLQRASTDLVGRSPTTSDLELFRVVGGLEGDFDIAGMPWFWNASYSWGRSTSTVRSTALVHQNFVNAVDVVDEGEFLTGTPNGNPVCRVTVDPDNRLDVTGTAGADIRAVDECVPLNLFGQGQPSAEAVDFVTADTLAQSQNRQSIVNLNLGGELFELNENPIAFNVGYEHRNELQGFTPDGFLQEGLGRSIPISPVTGEFDTNEFFGEVLVPIFQPYNDDFLYLMELDGSVRYIDNSGAGTDWVWSVGGRVGVIPDFTIRGSYTESVRAPAITELFLPEVSIFSFADDPCDQDYIDQGNVPETRAANCAADGITQPFSSIIDDASQQIRSAGNPDLLNEKSQSWTVGVIAEPTFVPRLVVTADWIDIHIDDAIVDATLTDILESCYDSPDFPNEENCGLFTRDADGQISEALTQYLNAATVDFSGLQTSIRYSMDVGPGELGFLGRYFYLNEREQNLNGVINTFDGEIGNSKHEASAVISYDFGGTSVTASGTYLSSAVYDNEADELSRNILGVGDHVEFDLQVAQEIFDNFTMRATIVNLFDTKPPFPAANSTTYNSALLGRRFRIGASVQF